MKEEEYMRVGTTLYKVVNQPCANGGYEKKRVVWNNSTSFSLPLWLDTSPFLLPQWR